MVGGHTPPPPPLYDAVLVEAFSSYHPEMIMQKKIKYISPVYMAAAASTQAMDFNPGGLTQKSGGGYAGSLIYQFGRTDICT